MSLRYQINLRILMLSGFILLLGSSIAIWQARTSVKQEIESSINLAVQLITLDFSQASKSPYSETDWLPKFNALKQTRHLSIQLREPSGQLIGVTKQNQRAQTPETPPQWFINLVKGTYPKVERPITTFDGKQLSLIIQANPLDEITEVWQESIAFFCTLLLLTGLTFLAVNLVFNKALKAITVIVNALKVIETGHYQQKLPEFATEEYDSIAKAINHMTDELNTAQQANRALTLHSLSIQENERQRLSQELHDELGQSLTAIKVMAVTAARKPSEVTATTDKIVSVCDHLISVVRSMMRQLHPLVLTELGLKASVEDLLNQWAERTPGLKLTLNCPDAIDNLTPTITIQVFRVIQEALTNIVRHAEAHKASITLAITPASNTLHLEIIDDGQGSGTTRPQAGFGLLSMRERINSLGGELSIQIKPQQGMCINASIPLS
ncbi:MAG: histidine kinase [Methylococcaceae bacterium]|nr:histidine kinase [Methylococcaceae bacterium]